MVRCKIKLLFFVDPSWIFVYCCRPVVRELDYWILLPLDIAGIVIRVAFYSALSSCFAWVRLLDYCRWIFHGLSSSCHIQHWSSVCWGPAALLHCGAYLYSCHVSCLVHNCTVACGTSFVVDVGWSSEWAAVNSELASLAISTAFSTYKNANTLKDLVGCSPRGLVSYISDTCGGSTSDLQICERSGRKYVELLWWNIRCFLVTVGIGGWRNNSGLVKTE